MKCPTCNIVMLLIARDNRIYRECAKCGHAIEVKHGYVAREAMRPPPPSTPPSTEKQKVETK